MSGVYSVANLAKWHADSLWKSLHSEDQEVLVKEDYITRESYNFCVTGFNLSTVLLIVSISLAVFMSSPFFTLIAILSYFSRKAFMDEIDQIFDASCNISGEAARGILSINDHYWEPIAKQILDFRLWMNWTYSYTHMNAKLD